MPPFGHIVVGLIGGIACGKSTVARMFRRLGARVIDADRIARGMLRRREVKAALRVKFGEHVTSRNGTINRKALAASVFRSPRALRFLNRLIHPIVLREVVGRLNGQKTSERALARRNASASGKRGRSPSVVVLDAPLLLETGLDKLCSHLVFVDAPLALRRRRAVETRAWTAADLARREACQAGLKKKRVIADSVVDNTGSLSNTRNQVGKFFASIRNLTKSPV